MDAVTSLEAFINFLWLLVTISSSADGVDLWSFPDLCDLCAQFNSSGKYMCVTLVTVCGLRVHIKYYLNITIRTGTPAGQTCVLAMHAFMRDMISVDKQMWIQLFLRILKKHLSTRKFGTRKQNWFLDRLALNVGLVFVFVF